ncbi:hypothetical protein C7M84_017548 [Penaeus vannamei]|uniref:Peptidase A2 domain-containing protein n=1 Tax=Penaeus vannamei TaxID=6689 RepID=A0A423SJZ7_PENVA|nr:hypothetical protein C7M84_017548 [Penaeus vannamei]
MTPPSVVRCERVISAPGVAAEGMWLGGAFFGQNNVGHRPTEHNRNHNEPLRRERQFHGTGASRGTDSGGAAAIEFEATVGASGAALDIKGRATLEFKFSRACKCRHSVFVVDDDTRFPAEVLIGVDLLRRFNFKLNLSPVSGASSASFNGVRLGVSFSGAGSLAILTYHEPEAVLRCCSASGGDREGAMRCARRVTCPHRAGRFVRCLVNGLKGGLACVESDTAKVLVPRSLVDLSQPEVDVWVVNDQTVPVEIEQGFVLCYAAIVEVSLNRLEYDAESMDQDSGVNPEDVGSSSGDSRGALDMASSTPIDDGSEPDSLMADFEDRFDFAHGLNDFGYNMDEFEVFLASPVTTSRSRCMRSWLKFERLNSRFSALEGQYANIVRLLEPRASEPHIHSPAAASASQVEAGVHVDHSSQRAPVNPRPLDQGITLRDPIPPYRAEVPASQPLRRNQELETWLRHVEQAHPYGTDEALIRAARGSCRGTADIVINSPVFDGIGTWDEFKETLRQRLRGTCSSMEYLRHLGSYVLGDTSPRDFYLAVETMVYQGMRDYPGELGPAEPLMRRTFLQGLPPWLREKLLLIEDQPLYRVVEAAQKVWHHRHYAGRVEKPLVSFSSEAGPKPRSSTPREGRSPAASPPVDPLAELPVRTREPRRWCPYHQVTTHDASECRAVREGNQCTRCGRRGHVAGGAFFGQNNVGHRPTEHNRNHNEPLPGTMMMAGAEGSDSSTEPELPEAQIQAGRPLLNCVVAGTKVLAFLDSGSEATVVKESCFRRISNTPLSPHPRGLRGASGAALDIKGRATLEFKFSRACKCRHSVFVVDDDTRFPAEVLIGVDLLRRFNFKLNLSPVSGASSASFNGVQLGVSFSGAGSLGILTYHEPEAVLRCCSASGGDREGAMRCAVPLGRGDSCDAS